MPIFTQILNPTILLACCKSLVIYYVFTPLWSTTDYLLPRAIELCSRIAQALNFCLHIWTQLIKVFLDLVEINTLIFVVYFASQQINGIRPANFPYCTIFHWNLAALLGGTTALSPLTITLSHYAFLVSKFNTLLTLRHVSPNAPSTCFLTHFISASICIRARTFA